MRLKLSDGVKHLSTCTVSLADLQQSLVFFVLLTDTIVCIFVAFLCACANGYDGM